MIGICLNITDLDLVFASSSDVAMATDFMAKCGYMRLYGIERRLKTACNIAIPIQKYSMAIY